MNVTLNITSVPDQEAFLVDATTVTPSGHRWIEAKAVRKAETDGLIIRIDGPNNAKFCYPPDHPNPGAHP